MYYTHYRIPTICSLLSVPDKLKVYKGQRITVTLMYTKAGNLRIPTIL